MVPCPGRVLRYQGERLRAADHVASSSAAVKDVSRLRLPVRRTRYFRWACRGLSETPRGSSLDEWAAAERVLVQFLALPVLPGAASTTSGPPRRAPSWRICCSSDRHTGTPCCTRSGLVAHVDFGLAFDLRRREVLFRAGFELSESRRVGGWRSAAPLLQSCSDGVPLSRLVGRDCAALYGWRQHSPGVRASGLQTGYGRCSLEVRKRLHTALRQARGRLRSEPGGRHVRRVQCPERINYG